MSLSTEHDQEVVREIVRGERPWTDLREVGIEIKIEDDVCTLENPRNMLVSAEVADLARGLLQGLPDPEQLRLWAFMLEAEDFLDWGDGERHPAWETLWDAVWKASFGEPISREAIQTAKELAGGTQDAL